MSAILFSTRNAYLWKSIIVLSVCIQSDSDIFSLSTVMMLSVFVSVRFKEICFFLHSPINLVHRGEAY